ncbi:MAG: hypothetical protein ABFD23_06595 [Caldisericales bacterium]|nr:hypothetical protein [bacterium]
MKLDLSDTIKLVDSWTGDIKQLYTELEEAQQSFNAELVKLHQDSKSRLEKSAVFIKGKMDSLPGDLKNIIEKEKTTQEKLFKEKLEKIESELAKLNKEAGEIEEKNIQKLVGLSKENPELNEQEEALKPKIEEAKKETLLLSRQLAKYDGISGWFAGSKVTMLEKEYKKSLDRLKQLTAEIENVRKAWKKDLGDNELACNEITRRWMAIQSEAASLLVEKSEIQGDFDSLVLMAALGPAVESFSGKPGLPKELDENFKAIAKNKEKANLLVEGLKKMSSILGSLNGISEGLSNIRNTFKGLLDEQNMHQALKKLEITVPESATKFHSIWKDVALKVKDEKKLCENPKDLAESVDGIIKNNLTESGIKGMFEDVAGSIKEATASWKG